MKEMAPAQVGHTILPAPMLRTLTRLFAKRCPAFLIEPFRFNRFKVIIYFYLFLTNKLNLSKELDES
jgi:hypothetical protein